MNNAREIVAAVVAAMHKHGVKAKDLPGELNKHLKPQDQITNNERSATVQVSRWLDCKSIKWVEPRANIVLAMVEFLKEHK